MTGRIGQSMRVSVRRTKPGLGKNRTGWPGRLAPSGHDAGDAFIMQLDDSFGINLGDAGWLYVYRYGATADCA